MNIHSFQKRREEIFSSGLFSIIPAIFFVILIVTSTMSYADPFVTQVAVGYNHSCALTITGGVKCWGQNLHGQLGNGTTTDSNTPVDVIGLSSGVKAIVANGNRSYALLESGGVKCWGDNSSGYLGDGTKTNRSTPVDVFDLTSGVTSISAGENHSCAIINDGKVKCWGFNGNGEIGDGTHGTDKSRYTPVDVTILKDKIVEVATYGSYTCVLTIEGQVQCWGYNNRFQLGVEGASLDKPTEVNLGGKAIAIGTGREHTCALMDTGGVKCWGDNWSGTLGNGNTELTRTIEDVLGFGTSNKAIAISLGVVSTCAITHSGSARCWGMGRMLGDGSGIDRSVPVDVTGLSTGVTSIAVNFSHACASVNNGGVKCWGMQGSGQLGNGATSGSSSVPVDVVGLSGGEITQPPVTEPPREASFEEGVIQGKQQCINDPASCGIQIPDTATLTETVKQQCASDPASCGIQAHTPCPNPETIKRQCVDDPASCGIQMTSCNTTAVKNDVVFDAVTKILSIPWINVPVESEGVQSVEPFEAQLQLNSVDANGTIQLGVTRLNPVNQPLPDILPEHPALDKGLELTKLYLTMKNKDAAKELLGELQKADKLIDFLNSLNQYADDPVKQVLYTLETYLKASKYILFGSLVSDGILIETYNALEGHFDELAKVSGESENFYLKINKERFGSDNISDAEVEIHQVTYYNNIDYAGQYVFSDGKTTYTGIYKDGLGYSFKTEQGFPIKSGLYVAEIRSSYGTSIQPVFVKSKWKQTITLSLD